MILFFFYYFFFFNDTATTEIYTLSLHDALPISKSSDIRSACWTRTFTARTCRSCLVRRKSRSEEHTSELQSRLHLVCRLLLEKKKNKKPSLQQLKAEHPQHHRRLALTRDIEPRP